MSVVGRCKYCKKKMSTSVLVEHEKEHKRRKNKELISAWDESELFRVS